MRRALQNCTYVLLSRQGKFEIGLSRYKSMQLTEDWVLPSKAFVNSGWIQENNGSAQN